MANNSKKINAALPAPNNTYPGEQPAERVTPLAYDLLPSVFKTDINKKVFNGFIEEAFQPSRFENINFKIGKRLALDNPDVRNSFLPSAIQNRRQLEAAITLPANNAILTANDIANAMHIADDHLAEVPQSVSVLDLPINPDKFINWSNYYWLDTGMPVIYLTGAETDSDFGIIDVEKDIVGKQHFTFPVQPNGRTLELLNGMRIVLQESYPGRDSIIGNKKELIVANGSNQTTHRVETARIYNKNLARIFVNDMPQDPNDYKWTAQAIIWDFGHEPNYGDIVRIEWDYYWVTRATVPQDDFPYPAITSDRVWLVAGVGTAEGIQLLPYSAYFTTTVYSSTIQSQWDQTPIAWDNILWDGDIPGINKKHYFLQAVGAENRNAFSRVNVWTHKDTIFEVARFLDLDSKEFVDQKSVALRPIVEFEKGIEMFSHGTVYREMCDGIVDNTIPNINPFDFIGSRVIDLLIKTVFGGTLENKSDLFNNLRKAIEINDTKAFDRLISNLPNPPLAALSILRIKSTLTLIKQSKLANIRTRILWLNNGVYKNKIVTFRTDTTQDQVIGFSIESAKDGDTTFIASGAGEYSLFEYYWKNGECIPAQTRMSATQLQLFNVYDRNLSPIHTWQSLYNVKPSKVHTTIIELDQSSNEFDSESGFCLTFDKTVLKILPDSEVSNAMYDIKYKSTLQDPITYLDTKGNMFDILSPFYFQRLDSLLTGKPQNLLEGASNGYRRAWFKIRSWASNTFDLELSKKIELHPSSWPVYKYALTEENGLPKVLFPDTYLSVVENLIVAGVGEILDIETVGIQNFDVYDYKGNAIFNCLPDSAGRIKIQMPDVSIPEHDSIDGFFNVNVNGQWLKLLVINPKFDPRAPIVTNNGNLVDYTFDISRDSNGNITGLTVILPDSVTGQAEIKYQGQFINQDDHCTAIPWLEYNPKQDINFGTFSPARVSKGMSQNINFNSGNRHWEAGYQLPAANGILMTDTSIMKGAWAELRLIPNLTESMLNRSAESWRWWRKFMSEIDQAYDNFNFQDYTIKENLDFILTKLNIGTNLNQADATSGMAFITTMMSNVTYSSNGTQQKYKLPFPDDTTVFYKGPYGSDHLYVYIDDEMQIRNYTVDDNSITFNQSVPAGKKIDLYCSREGNLFSGIPASPAKLGLDGIYKPKIIRETWGKYDRVLIRRHDGSHVLAYQEHNYSGSDIRDLLILELENRIYTAAMNQLRRPGNANRQRTVRDYSSIPSPVRARATINWFNNNGFDFRNRFDYVADDPWTWNYNGLSWRGMYLKEFGTYRLDTCPWEALGYDEKPNWWDSHYSWVDPDKRIVLEDSLRNGKISEPGIGLTHDFKVRRYSKTNPQRPFPVDSTGTLIPPNEWLGINPTPEEAAAPWEVGSMGPVEDVWFRSPAGAWCKLLDILSNLFSTARFVETGIMPFNSFFRNNSPTPIGDRKFQADTFIQSRPTIGVGAILYEAARSMNLNADHLLGSLISLENNLAFGVGGYTDETIKFKMYFTRYQDGPYVPSEDFSILLNPSVALSAIRYSAVRVQKDMTGYRVFGFDPEARFFEINQPIKTGPSGAETGTTRRTISAANGQTYTQYLKFSFSITQIPYGFKFEDKQSLFEFFLGLDNLQSQKGLLFDQLNSRGTVANWMQCALDAITWIDENWGAGHACIVGPIAKAGFKFQHKFGHLDKMDTDITRLAKVIFTDGTVAQSRDMLISRGEEADTDFVQCVNGKQIGFVDLKLRNYEHAVKFNNKTRFGDLIWDAQSNLRLDNFRIVGRRTSGWTGRPSATGFYLTSTGLVQGYESLVTDQIESKRIERSQVNTFLGEVSKGNVVPDTISVLDTIIEDESVLFSFKQGLKSASGTDLSINAILRDNSIDSPDRSQDLKINEQWMFTNGDFGRLDGRKIWEIELRKIDITNDRQIVRFIGEKNLDGSLNYDQRSDQYIDLIGKKDPRWVNRDYIDPLFQTIPRGNITPAYTIAKKWLPSAGTANLLTTDFQIIRFDDIVNGTELYNNENFKHLLSIYGFSKFYPYVVGDLAWQEGRLYKAINNVQNGTDTVFQPSDWELYLDPVFRYLPTIWISDYHFTNFNTNDSSKEKDDYGWNVLQVTGPSYIEEICPNKIDINAAESKLTFGSPHKLEAGDHILISGSRDQRIDRIHEILRIDDDFNVIIPVRTSGDYVIYNVVCFGFLGTKFKTLYDLQNTLGTSVPIGQRAYVEPDGSPEGEYYVYKFTGQWTLDTEYTTAGKTMVDTNAIDHAEILDSETGEVIDTISIYDPYKGRTIDEVSQYLDYIQTGDPADYNITDIGQVDLDSASPWGAEQLGKLWWDTSEIRYVEYEQSNIDYRAAHWGEKISGSKVVVYEWTKSLIEPIVDTTAIVDIEAEQPQGRIDTSGGGKVIRFSIKNEYDATSNKFTDVYYFWANARLNIPTNVPRPYSAAAIESTLNNPDLYGVTWTSPIASNALLISNIRSYLDSRDSIILRLVQKNNAEQQHINSELVSEGKLGDEISNYLYLRLRTSVSGRDNYRKSADLYKWQPGRRFFKGDLIFNPYYSYIDLDHDIYGPRDIPVLEDLDSGRDQHIELFRPKFKVTTDNRLVSFGGEVLAEADDPQWSQKERLHRVFQVAVDGYVCGPDNASFFNDYLEESLIVSSTSALVKGLLERGANTYRAVTVSRRRVPDIKLHPLRRYGNNYVPLAQSWFKDIVAARRNLVVAANAYLLKINAIAKPHWDAHLRKFQPIFGPFIKDITPYWKYVDYVSDDYIRKSEQALVKSISEIANLDDSIQVVGIIDKKGILQKTVKRDGNNLTVLYHKNGTIQFLKAVWDGSMGDAWDRYRWDLYGWDEDGSELLESIMDALRYDLFVEEDIGYFNLVFFDMVKESLRQIPNADWVTKTTYIDVRQTTQNDFSMLSTYYDKRDFQISTYINEVKPYHTEIETKVSNYATLEEVSVGISESLVIKIKSLDTLLADENGFILTDEDNMPLDDVNGPSVTVTYPDGVGGPVDNSNWWEKTNFNS